MRRRWVLAGVAALAGCSLLPQTPYVQRRDWPLDVRRPVGGAAPGRDGRVLLVRSVRAGPGLEARGLQWLQRDGSVHVDFYEQWAVPPAQAVEDDLRQWLADAGLFARRGRAGQPAERRFRARGRARCVHRRPERRRRSRGARAGPAGSAAGIGEGAAAADDCRRGAPADTEPPAIAEAMKAALTEVLRQTETVIAAAVR